MATSLYRKGTRGIRTVATGTGASGTTTRLQLNRDFLVTEHRVAVSVSQANSGTDPTSVDVRDFIGTVSLETSDGRRIFLTGAEAYDIGRFYEQASSVVTALGATSTAQYAFDLHHAGAGAKLDLLSALRTNEFSTVDLVITWNAAGSDGFKGGTAAAAAAYTVSVLSEEYPDMLTDVQFGQLLGTAKHFQEKLGSKTGTAAGSQPDIAMITGNLTRNIMFHVYDTATTAVPTLSDAVLNTIRLNINGKDYRVMTARNVRDDNIKENGFDQVGVYALFFGDDANGYLDLTKVQQANLTWDVAAGTPAGYRVDIMQDYFRSAQQ